jgi:hypothetical protein
VASVASTARDAHLRTAPKVRKHGRRRPQVACKRLRRRLHGRRALKRLPKRCRPHGHKKNKKKAHTTKKQASRLPVLGHIASGNGPIRGHVETWGYDDCGNGGSGAGVGLVRQWLSFAETNCGPGGDGKGLSDCHAGGVVYCQVMQYLDSQILYYSSGSSSPQWSSWSAVAQEGWYLHQPSSSARVSTPAFGGGYFDNQGSAGVQGFYQAYVRAHFPSEDGLFMDDQASGVPELLWGSSSSSSTEASSDSQLQAAHAAMSAALTRPSGQAYPQVDNTIPDGGNPSETSQGLGMLTGPTQGLLTEGAPMVNGSLDPFYPGLLDDIAYVENKTPGYVVMLSYGASGASYQPQSRRVQEATDLLGYAPGRIVNWAELEQGSANLAVWPEEGVYPTAPVQSMGAPGGSGCLSGNGAYCATGGHNDVQVAAGVYRREFGACYNQSVKFGPCAAIVNTTGSAITVPASWLTQSYHHQATLTGGDVQSGGTLNLTGATFTAASTTIAAHDAAMLTP